MHQKLVHNLCIRKLVHSLCIRKLVHNLCIKKLVHNLCIRKLVHQEHALPLPLTVRPCLFLMMCGLIGWKRYRFLFIVLLYQYYRCRSKNKKWSGMDTVNHFNPAICFVCPKSEFLSPYVMVCFVFSSQRSEVVTCFVEINGIVDHHYLNFLFISYLWFTFKY